MNNKVDANVRVHFRNLLREELRKLEFYNRRGNHYLIREFAKYCAERGPELRKLWPEVHFPSRFFDIDEASLGRYLREDNPVMPTPNRIRALALILEWKVADLMKEAGYFSDFDTLDARTTPQTATETATTTTTTVIQNTKTAPTTTEEKVEPEQLVSAAD